jgi:hypothetical protein
MKHGVEVTQSRPEQWIDRRIERRGLRPRDAAYLIAAFWAVAVVVFGVLERIVDPKTFHSVWMGMWWAIETVTTVGYGDIVPDQTAGKVIAGFLMLGGLSPARRRDRRDHQRLRLPRTGARTDHRKRSGDAEARRGDSTAGRGPGRTRAITVRQQTRQQLLSGGLRLRRGLFACARSAGCGWRCAHAAAQHGSAQDEQAPRASPRATELVAAPIGAPLSPWTMRSAYRVSSATGGVRGRVKACQRPWFLWTGVPTPPGLDDVPRDVISPRPTAEPAMTATDLSTCALSTVGASTLG